MIKIEDKLKSVESESGVLASLIQNPELVFYSEFLKPKDFSNLENQAVYAAIQNIAPMGIQNVDAYIIMESLKSSEGSRRYEKYVDLERLKEFVEMSPAIARHDVEEYMLLVHNVMDAALRRETLQKLQECEKYCTDLGVTDLEQRIYGAIDDVMMEFSTANEIPQFRDVVDDCWREICDRQNDGYAGIPFKFPTLNEYATIEKGELFIFAAEAKQGKSMMLLNCAVDLLKKDKKVLYLDSELNTRLFTARMLSHLTGIEYKRLTAGTYDAEEAERIEGAIGWLKTRDFTHIYMPMFDIQTIYASIQKVRHTQGVDVLIVDYFKGSGDGDAYAAYAELGRFVDTIKNRVAGEMGIAAIGAVQATATGKVADSAKIGRNASVIALLQDKTPDEIEIDGVECGNKKLRIVLNRNGPQMTSDQYLDLMFDGNRVLYREAKQHIPQEPF